MAIHVYPALFSKEENGMYSVYFPDFDCTNYSCTTGGNDLKDAMVMANDALCLTLYGMEDDGATIPTPSDMSKIDIQNSGDFVSLVQCDTTFYHNYYSKKAVRKTLTIPAYLNVIAEKEGINFSHVLQEALKRQLGV